MSERETPADTWRRRVLAALADPTAIASSDLWVMRDAAGALLRPMGPPDGVTPRHGAVLLLLTPDGDDLRLPLTVRSAHMTNHRGEVSLPGGRVEPGDGGLVGAALRECHEELGIDPAEITVIGRLEQVYIPPSNFLVVPVVGWIEHLGELRPDPGEVEAVLSVSLRRLLAPNLLQFERRSFRDAEISVPSFPVDGYSVWGATALILSELVARLRRSQA